MGEGEREWGARGGGGVEGRGSGGVGEWRAGWWGSGGRGGGGVEGSGGVLWCMVPVQIRMESGNVNKHRHCKGCGLAHRLLVHS